MILLVPKTLVALIVTSSFRSGDNVPLLLQAGIHFEFNLK
jgi:hypothetical protein